MSPNSAGPSPALSASWPEPTLTAPSRPPC